MQVGMESLHHFEIGFDSTEQVLCTMALEELSSHAYPAVAMWHFL